MALKNLLNLPQIHLPELRLPQIIKEPAQQHGRLSYDDLVNAEAELGRTIFGPIPAGHQREFFSYKKNVWIWYESYVEVAGVAQEMTIRYEVRPAGVFKKVANSGYTKIEGAELDNFRTAAKNYLQLVKTNLYS